MMNDNQENPAKLADRDLPFTHISEPFIKIKAKAFLDTVGPNPVHADHRDVCFKVTMVNFQVFTCSSLETAAQMRLEVDHVCSSEMCGYW